MNKKVFDHVLQIKIQMDRMQAELDDYKLLMSMEVSDLENLLAELVREELANQIRNPWDNSGFPRKMRVQDVLSGRR
jgi:hypothetical protein